MLSLSRGRFVSVCLTTLILGCSAGANGIGDGSGGQTSEGVGGAGAALETGPGGSDAEQAGGSTAEFMGLGGGVPTDCGDGPDADADGFTVEDGDCNDCDANVNPGAIEVIGGGDGEGGAGGAGGGSGEYIPADEDCDDQIDELPEPYCDDVIAADSPNPIDGARAIELCKVATSDKDWGVLDTKFVRANGSPTAANAQVGFFSSFGPNVPPRGGLSMLGLSSGKARLPTAADTCTSSSCSVNGSGSPPPGFPQDVPNCPVGDAINDDIGLEVTMRAPTNATGYQFDFKFQSFEFAEYVCTRFNDQFVALVNPPPVGSQSGNISFDSQGNPVSVNIAFFDVCSSCTDLAANCDDFTYQCPTPQAGCCSQGPAELVGTGFDNGFGASFPEDAGATTWLQTRAPVTGGETITIRFAIWDVGDTALDSTALVDNFEWIANTGTIAVETTPAQ